MRWGAELTGRHAPWSPTVPTPEKVKRRLLFNMFEVFENCKIVIVSAKCKVLYTHFLMFKCEDKE
jgi:hypothetical protein